MGIHELDIKKMLLHKETGESVPGNFLILTRIAMNGHELFINDGFYIKR